MTSVRELGCTALFIACCLTTSLAPRDAVAADVVLTGSAWPPWETARAMDQLEMSPGVRYEFRAYVDSITLFEIGRADAMLVNLYDYLTLCRDRKFAEETAIVLITNYSEGGDVVVTRPDIEEAADLKGKRIGLDIQSISLYMLHLSLQQVGLNLSDVELTRVKGEHVAKAFERSESLDAVVGWNPYAAEAIQNGGRPLVDSSAFPGEIVDVMVVRRSSLKANRPIYQDFVRAWFEARQSPQVLAKMAELNNVNVDEFRQWLADARIFNTPQASLQAMTETSAAIERIEEFLANNREAVPDSIKSNFGPPEYKGSLVDSSLLEELVQ